MSIKHLASKNVQDSEQRAKNKKQAVPLRTVHFGALVDADPRPQACGFSLLSMLTNRYTVGLIETGRVMTFRENFELLGILMGDRGLMLDLCCA